MENQNDNTEMIKNLTNILEGLDNSQEQLEKNAFDVINSCKREYRQCRRNT